MNRGKWVTWVSRVMIGIATGTTLLGTSCGAEVRDAVIGAGADFVGTSLTAVLEHLFPVEDIVRGQ